MKSAAEESRFEAGWRRPAPRARAAAKALFGWRAPAWVFLAALLATLPFLLAALLAPALLSLAPTVDMIAPIAGARAMADGAALFRDSPAPFYALLLLAADLAVDAPGRIHLVAKTIAALLAAWPLAWLAASRFPAGQAVLMTAAIAAYVAAPFSGPAEIALAFFLVVAVALMCASADESAGRARIEGGIAGAGLAALWLLNPAFSLAGFLALSSAPFIAGRPGLTRYVAAFAVFLAFGALAELLAPGVNFARADAASGLLASGVVLSGGSAAALGGVAVATVVVILAAAVFGGGEHWRGWGAAAALVIIALIAARLSQANASLIFAFAAALACFSVASPFYDGVFRQHDRASIAVALAVAALTLFWTAAIPVHAAGQFLLQHRAAEDAPEQIRAELGLVQPGGPTIARWIEEGRFSTPEARDLFALAPVDQSAMLLEAAGKAREFARSGFEVAILTDADSACVIAAPRDCRVSGAAAAGEASVVFAPRIDLDAGSAAARGRAEALLYTEFRLVEQTPFWDVWVRRGATLPAEMIAARTGA